MVTKNIINNVLQCHVMVKGNISTKTVILYMETQPWIVYVCSVAHGSIPCSGHFLYMVIMYVGDAYVSRLKNAYIVCICLYRHGASAVLLLSKNQVRREYEFENNISECSLAITHIECTILNVSCGGEICETGRKFENRSQGISDCLFTLAGGNNISSGFQQLVVSLNWGLSNRWSPSSGH